MVINQKKRAAKAPLLVIIISDITGSSTLQVTSVHGIKKPRPNHQGLSEVHF
ncbi:MAG: hypothetical protein ACI8YQ_003646 [Polaribacter sp.]|jgi:hypothetical protein